MQELTTSHLSIQLLEHPELLTSFSVSWSYNVQQTLYSRGCSTNTFVINSFSQQQCVANVFFFDKWISEYIRYCQFITNECPNIFSCLHIHEWMPKYNQLATFSQMNVQIYSSIFIFMNVWKKIQIKNIDQIPWQMNINE